MLHLQSPHYISLRVSRKEAPLSRFPLRSPYLEKDAPSPEPSLHIFKAPGKESSLQVSLTESLRTERCSRLQSPLYISFKVLRKGAPLQVLFSEPHRNRRSVPRTFLYLSLEVPGERTPPPGFLSGTLRREMLITMAFYT
jgi:hypothetical protein